MAYAALPTPLFQAAAGVFLKCEFLHPGRSHKARVAHAMIQDAEDRGEIGPGGRRTLLERTGGNLGIALAIEASIRGYRLTLVTDPGYSASKKQLASRLGATVIDRGVAYPGCATNQAVIDVLLAAADADYLYLNQFGNPVNLQAHEQGTGAEILAQLVSQGYGRGTTVALVGGLGTGASLKGVSAALRTWFTSVLTFAVEPPGCNLLAEVYVTHSLQGIAVGQPPPFFDVGQLDGVVPVSQTETARALAELATKYRFLVGPSSGANYAAVNRVREEAIIRPKGTCIYVSFLYDRGEDYL